MKMEQTESSETLTFKLQMPGNNPEESIRHSTPGESLKPRTTDLLQWNIIIFINCNWVVTRWQWLFNTYTKHEIGLENMKLVYKT
jgi:hypothetical protein